MTTISFRVGERELAKLKALKKSTKLTQSKILRSMIHAITVTPISGQKNSDASGQASTSLS